MDCVGKQWPISGYWAITCYLLTKYQGFTNKMKTFYIILIFLGGIFSGSTYMGMNSDFFDDSPSSSVVDKRIEIKQVYLPWLGCKIGKSIDADKLEEYARACFAIGPENIKMTFPSI